MVIGYSSPLEPVMPVLQASQRFTVVDVARSNRIHERTEALAFIRAFNVAFNIDVGSNSIIVTLSDRTSGEIFRKLVYDQSGALQLKGIGVRGELVDVRA